LPTCQGRWIDAVHDRRPPKSITLDMDSSESPVHGGQEGAAWNGHFQSKCLHPLFVLNQFGDLERCALRPGNVHSADGWEELLTPVLARYSAEARPSITRRRFRADAAFAIPELFDLLEADGWDYAIRIKGNRKLYDQVAFLTRRPGRPPHHLVRHYTSFHYRAKSWSKARRVVAKVEFHPGELFPAVGFIVTNRSLPNERVLAFYNARGTAEQHIKEGKHALKWTRLSCMRFAANAVRLQLHALAYNLANFLRTLGTPAEIERWSPTPLRARVFVIGADDIAPAAVPERTGDIVLQPVVGPVEVPGEAAAEVIEDVAALLAADDSAAGPAQRVDPGFDRDPIGVLDRRVVGYEQGAGRCRRGCTCRPRGRWPPRSRRRHHRCRAPR
jgi:Transposase DDE domain group 1